MILFVIDYFKKYDIINKLCDYVILIISVIKISSLYNPTGNLCVVLREDTWLINPKRFYWDQNRFAYLVSQYSAILRDYLGIQNIWFFEESLRSSVYDLLTLNKFSHKDCLFKEPFRSVRSRVIFKDNWL